MQPLMHHTTNRSWIMKKVSATQAPSKATKAIGNLNVEGAKDIYKNQLTGEHLVLTSILSLLS